MGPDETTSTTLTGKAEADPADNGLPTATSIAEIRARPSDLIEKWIEVPEWADESGEPAHVKIKTLTAAERARIRQVGMQRMDSPVGWAEMEVQQFMAAVVEPPVTEHEARWLHQNRGPGFQRIIDEHDELSSMGKEELTAARREFREGAE